MNSFNESMYSTQFNSLSHISMASLSPFWSHCIYDNQYQNLGPDKKSVDAENTRAQQRAVYLTDTEVSNTDAED